MIKNTPGQGFFVKQAIDLLKQNIIDPSDPDCQLNWMHRQGPWGKNIDNLLMPPEAGEFITPNKNTFVGQWYWDTMGTNVGLLRSGDDQLGKIALSMTKNLFLLYDKAGLVPNAADSVQTTRSQPPFLSSMCLEIGNHLLKDDHGEKVKWFSKAYKYCKKEVLSPWEEFSTEYGFQWFDKIKILFPGHSPEETLQYFRPESRSDYRILRSMVYRIMDIDLEAKKPLEYEKILPVIMKALSKLNSIQRKSLCDWLYSRRLVVASGMDFTASYGLKPIPGYLKEILEPRMLSISDQVYSCIEDISPIDLNCLIYRYYEDLAALSRWLFEYGDSADKKYYQDEISTWDTKKSSLKKLILEVHYSDKDHIFFNYDTPRSVKMHDLPHLTHYAYPLFCQLADDKIARVLMRKIKSLKTGYGVKLTHKKTGYQWDFNMWPLQTWLTVKGLMNYNFHEEAMEIMAGYKICAEKVYLEKGSFYEKYNAEDGSIQTDGRYPAEPGFSWGAGVYLAVASML